MPRDFDRDLPDKLRAAPTNASCRHVLDLAADLLEEHFTTRDWWDVLHEAEGGTSE